MKFDAHLASIHSEEEMNFVSMLYNLTDEGYIWIGGQRDGQMFRWTDSSPFIYDNWAIGTPDNEFGNEDCIFFYFEPSKNYHKKWNDEQCNAFVFMNAYICKKDK